MRGITILFFLLFCFNGVLAQGERVLTKGAATNTKDDDSLFARPGEMKDFTQLKKKKQATGNITDYLIVNSESDTTFVDTTLTIYKDYKFNYLRKDDFEVIPFSNLGQTYNTLSYNFQDTRLMPSFGARARHFNYMEIEDINYYRVPTPLTELFFKTAFEQGQLVDAFFTVNTSPQINYSIAYKGLRSIGKYQHIDMYHIDQKHHVFTEKAMPLYD